MYAVAIGPNAGTRCEDRATLWQIRQPAAETTMNQHYSDESVPMLTKSVLVLILDQLHGKIPLNIPMEKQVTSTCLNFISLAQYTWLSGYLVT